MEEPFQFTMCKINNISVLSLVKNNDIDYQNYFIAENINEFFDRLYDYYHNLSNPLIQFLNK
ncbi:MAG: hypothetical protein KGD63_01165 [Candidatus Lokiarchaeota archaeon]|nr:hypothetical protein [Candidatus Lokiarchaeota archaeon]